MLFLSVQPDDYYFLWQLQLQLFNFNELGIPAEKIHVLIGYRENKGVSMEYEEWMKGCTWATFFVYPIQQQGAVYASSIRPHLISRHFAAHPELENVPVFYHDSDVLLRALPCFEQMEDGQEWFVSDTRTYLDSHYIRKAGGEGLFEKMCTAVGIPQEMVVANDAHCGGAQYVIKNTNAAFWQKVEKDCETLFGLMSEDNDRRAEEVFINEGIPKSHFAGIQVWCADMWAVLWNAWLAGHTVKIHHELEFCWPRDPLVKWQETNMLHYAGVARNDNVQHFCKRDFAHFSPFYANLETIAKDTCSYPLVNLVNSFRQFAHKSRVPLRDVTCVLPHVQGGYAAVASWLEKYFDTHILVQETAGASWARQVHTPFGALFSGAVVTANAQLEAAVNMVRKEPDTMVWAHGTDITMADQLFQAIFTRMLDPDVFVMNHGKLHTYATGQGGSIILAAMQHITGTLRAMPDKKNIPGPLYYLPYES